MSTNAPTTVTFTCNICATTVQTVFIELDRETSSCPTCSSTPRFRSIIHALSCELFGESLPIDEFPQRFDLTGVGLSDWEGYAQRLATRFSYINSYFHQRPVLDITSGTAELEGKLDFIISSEVFEHIDPPVQRAFETAVRLLKPGGRLILSTPYGDGSHTHEHFPSLHKYSIETEGETPRLRNLTEAGSEEVFENLVFHGGPGATLEMRFFARRALMMDMLNAGFDSVTFYGPCRSRGIYWQESDWGLPIVARIARA